MYLVGYEKKFCNVVGQIQKANDPDTRFVLHLKTRCGSLSIACNSMHLQVSFVVVNHISVVHAILNIINELHPLYP